MNLTVTNAPTVAELARGVLEGQSLVAGESFYASGNGVVIVVAPLPPGEVMECWADHEITISTGFPPDPGTAGITVWLQRRGETGGQLERLGETDRFGALLFTPGAAGSQYQLTVTRGSGVRLAPEVVAILQFTAPTATPAEKKPEPVAAPCCVCRAVPLGWNEKLNALREAWGCGTPVCQSHLTGPENVVLAAARNAWHQKTPEVFQTCAKLLADLFDEHGAVRKGFLQPFPVELRQQALNQAAGLLSTAIAVGHVLSKNQAKAAIAGHAASVHFQAAMGTERFRNDWFATRLTTVADHPLGGLWSRVAPRVGGEHSQGFLAFRHLSLNITRSETDPPAFALLRDQPVAVRPLLYDRERATSRIARVEFHQAAEGCGEVYLDLASLGFHIVDPQFLRSLESAWRAIQPTFTREYPGMAICVRVADASAAPVFEGGAAGLAVACGLLAADRGEVLDADICVTGELLPGNGMIDLGGYGAGWTGRVTDKLEVAQSRGVRRVVVGVTEEGERFPGQLDRSPKPNFEAIPTRTVNDAYRALCRGPFVGKPPQTMGLY